MSIAVIITDRNTDELCHRLSLALPEVHIQQWPNIANPESIKLAVLWNHPPGITATFPQLQMVVSMGAGMDHIEADQAIAGNIKTARIVTDVLKQNMAQYVLQHILLRHRHYSDYQQQQNMHTWQILENSEMPTVGFLGLGILGGFVADQCRCLGLKTLAWTQSQVHAVHPCYHGEAGLQLLCAYSDYLVVLLPMNRETKNIINRQTLSWCKPNCTLINVGRGGHVVEQDLLAALDAGVIQHAVLDVFKQEPLSTGHPFWSHQKVTLTPHSSSRSDVEQTAEQIVTYYQNL
ncbi:MAG: hypothetical protein KDI92_07725 [Xanthomonadales bacterium]|nr:hypothetical protein [Xanthomonadales bacterium]